ncbi:glycolate oxidase subunit GlcE [Cupriavidus sp. 2SB]|uniref:glycolate oxidase subunit GlcE n=1 Tax=Cupriavidus sp. 2SB TaxID=2502199 RepID=UPI0010F75A6F|nr:glycolate oxidase subunit GlcE [Cupriavidus sp. 2SB]
MQSVLTQLVDTIREAGSKKQPLRFRGGGTKDFYGQSLVGDIVDTRGYAGIVDYDPAELVITARCGTELREIEAVLAESGQCLPFEPPHFRIDSAQSTATIGGAFAAGLSGPRRQSVGALRDFVLGAKLVDGNAQLLSFGGQVMKNVAGYDVSRLLAGSLGTLGLVTEISLKVLPIPAATLTLEFQMNQESALEFFNKCTSQPLPIAATAWFEDTALVKLAGARAAVRAATQKLGGQALPEQMAKEQWEGLRGQSHDFFARHHSEPLWRIAVPSVAPALRLKGEQLVEWGGGQRWWHAPDDHLATAEQVRLAARAVGGHATLFRNGEKSNGVFTMLPPAAWAIHKRLKATFDPMGIFGVDRMYVGL